MTEHNNNNKKDTVASSVLKKIEHGDVKMKSRTHFVLRAIVYAGVTLGVLVLGLYVASLISFTLRVNGYGYLPEFGIQGYRALFMSLPWVLVFVVLILIVALELLGKHYRFMYRRPLLYSVAFVLVVLIGGGLVIGKTQLHDALYSAAENNRLPFGSQLYKRYGAMPFENVHFGVIVDTSEAGYIIESPTEGRLDIIVTEKTRYPMRAEFLVDDKLMVIGTLHENKIEALGLKELYDEHVIRFKHHPSSSPSIRLHQRR